MHDFPFALDITEQVSATALVMYNPAIAFESSLNFGIHQCPCESVFDMGLNIAKFQFEVLKRIRFGFNMVLNQVC